ncbi:MAG: hypothetical protein ACPLZF_00250 [Nitrososphaeria archaeon]
MVTDKNKLFWLRVVFAIFAGLFSGVMNFSNESSFFGVLTIILFYLLSYFIGKYYIFSDKGDNGSLFTTGIGTYIMLSLFVWIFYYTLHVSGFL